MRRHDAGGSRGTGLLLGMLLLAGGPLAGCQTETRGSGNDAFDTAGRREWQVKGAKVSDGGHHEPMSRAPTPREVEVPDEIFDSPPRDPDEVVEVPVAAYLPIDAFFDHEGYLLGDRIEIDCSAEPFKARLGAMAAANEQAKFVYREEKREGDVHTVRLFNTADGTSHVQELLPVATFGSLRGFRDVDGSGGPVGDPSLRPFFEIVGTREIVVRFHSTPARDCPVFFRARAVGTPSVLHPEIVKQCVYVNANRGRLVRATELSLDLEIRRTPEGRWEPLIRDPGSPAGGAGGR